jgi:hypothetical protein
VIATESLTRMLRECFARGSESHTISSLGVHAKYAVLM